MVQLFYSPGFHEGRLSPGDVCESQLGVTVQLLDGDHAVLIRVELLDLTVSLQVPDSKEELASSFRQAEVEVEVFLWVLTALDFAAQLMVRRTTRFFPE